MYETQVRYLEVRSALLAGNPMGNLTDDRIMSARLRTVLAGCGRVSEHWLAVVGRPRGS